MTDIWTPTGFVNSDLRAAGTAVEEYGRDFGVPSLSLGRDLQSGEYVVLMDKADGTPHPVLALGTEIPSADTIKRKLYEADTARRGAEIVRDVDRANERAKKRLRDATHEGAGEVAEAMDVLFHKTHRHPVPRIFVPGKD